MVDPNDDQVRNEGNRQREREDTETRKRLDEAGPTDDQAEELGEFDAVLDGHNYPTTADELVERYGDHEVESKRGWKSIDEVLAPVDNEVYDSADDARQRILRLLYRE